MADLTDQILTVKRKLEQGGDDAKLLYLIQKLKRLPVTLEILQDTGIGKTVHSLRKRGGQVGESAKALVTAWKEVVANTNSEKPSVDHSSHASKDGGQRSDHSRSKSNDSSSSRGARTLTVEREDSYTVYGEDSYQRTEKSHKSSSARGDHRVSNQNVTHKSVKSESESRSSTKNGYSVEKTNSTASKRDSSVDPPRSSNSKSKSESRSTSSDRHSATIRSSSSSKGDKYSPTKTSVSSSKVDTTSPHKSSVSKSVVGKHSPTKSHVSSSRSDSVKVQLDVAEVRKKKHNDVSSDSKKVSSNSDKRSSSHGVNPSKTKGSSSHKAKKLLAKADEDGFTSSMASFEDILGLNDLKAVKKKKSSSPALSWKPKIPKLDAPIPNKRSHVSVKQQQPQSDSEPDIGDEFDDDDFDDDMAPPKQVKLSISADVDVDATLPAIQPNYKPIRYAMPDSPPRRKQGAVEIDTSLFMSSKHSRTQVFSGRRNAYSNEVPSLYELCVKVLQENIDALEYTGGVPYDRLKPVLARCTPQQLYQIEDFNPYLVEDTDELWMENCKADFRGQKPGEMETWREFYLRKFDEREAKLKSITANISAGMAKALPVRQTKLAYVDSVAKPPRSVRFQQAKYGTAGAAAKRDHSSSSKPAVKKIAPATSYSQSVTESVPRPPMADSGIANINPHPSSKVVKRVAPLMQKTLKLMKNRFRR